MRYQPSSTHGVDQLYEVLLPFLVDEGPSFNRYSTPLTGEEDEEAEGQQVRDVSFSQNLDQEIRAGRCGDFETIQRSGTCFFRIILSTLRYLWKRVGLSPAKVTSDVLLADQ